MKKPVEKLWASGENGSN